MIRDGDVAGFIDALHALTGMQDPTAREMLAHADALGVSVGSLCNAARSAVHHFADVQVEGDR